MVSLGPAAAVVVSFQATREAFKRMNRMADLDSKNNPEAAPKRTRDLVAQTLAATVKGAAADMIQEAGAGVPREQNEASTGGRKKINRMDLVVLKGDLKVEGSRPVAMKDHSDNKSASRRNSRVTVVHSTSSSGTRGVVEGVLGVHLQMLEAILAISR